MNVIFALLVIFVGSIAARSGELDAILDHGIAAAHKKTEELTVEGLPGALVGIAAPHAPSKRCAATVAGSSLCRKTIGARRRAAFRTLREGAT